MHDRRIPDPGVQQHRDAPEFSGAAQAAWFGAIRIRYSERPTRTQRPQGLMAVGTFTPLPGWAVELCIWEVLPVAGKRDFKSQFTFFCYIGNQINTMTSELTITVSNNQIERLIRKLLKGGHFSYSVDIVEKMTWEDLTLEDYRAMVRAQRPTIKSKSFRDGDPARL